MSNVSCAKIPTLALALSLAFGGCSKHNDPIESVKVTENVPGLKVQADRLVFTDNNSFIQIQKALSSMNTHQLDSWEKQLGFHSLRSLDITKQDPSTALMNTFGFPNQYATLISQQGEYQIGNRISWFHEGFRYVAHSEEELAAIKANPSVATERFSAGVKQANSLINISTENQGSTSAGNRVIRNSDNTTGDAKYGNFEFILNGDKNSRRKLNFSSVLYVEYVGDKMEHGPQAFPYYTSIYINEYYEWYSRGNNRWYRCDDYPRFTTYNLSTTFSVQGTGYSGSGGFNSGGTWYYSGVGQPISGTRNISLSGYGHSGGDYRTVVADTYIYLITSGGFTWDYEITGQYGSRLGVDTYGTSYHVENGILW